MDDDPIDDEGLLDLFEEDNDLALQDGVNGRHDFGGLAMNEHDEDDRDFSDDDDDSHGGNPPSKMAVDPGAKAEPEELDFTPNLASVILHVDMDCFYCQVEQKRLGIPPTQPLAVQQWQMLIAVNYAARARGVLRHDTATEALKKCKELKLIHVATYAEGESEGSIHVEKASVDEAFMDLTSLVEAELKKSGPIDLTQIGVDFEGLAFVAGNSAPQPPTLDDYRLYLGAKIAKDIRENIFRETGYTCTGGIAHNKMLAKIASAQNKPNKQTVVPFYVVRGLLGNLPLSKVRQMGGKLGRLVKEKLNVTLAGDLRQYSLAHLASVFGDETGQWLWNMTRGNVVEKITPRSKVKSMASAKQFPAIYEIEGIKKWMNILVSELVTRIFEEYEEMNRWPKTLQMHASTPSAERSKSCSMPPHKSREHLHAELLRLGLAMYNSLSEKFPCKYLVLAASGFFENDLSSPRISDFFSKALSALPPTQLQDPEAFFLKPATQGTTPVTDIKAMFRSQVEKEGMPPPTASTPPATPTPVMPIQRKATVEAPNLSRSSSSSSPLSRTPSIITPERSRPSATPRDFLDQESFSSLEPKLYTIVASGVTPEMRKSTLHRFFTSKRETMTDGQFLCELCHNWIPVEKRPEHMDYHFAVNLEKAQRAEEALAEARQSSSSAPLKRKGSVGSPLSAKGDKRTKKP